MGQWRVSGILTKGSSRHSLDVLEVMRLDELKWGTQVHYCSEDGRINFPTRIQGLGVDPEYAHRASRTNLTARNAKNHIESHYFVARGGVSSLVQYFDHERFGNFLLECKCSAASGNHTKGMCENEKKQ